MKNLETTVYPSNYPTVSVANDNDVYGGAHHYIFENCLGFANGETQYGGGTQSIQFVHKADDGTVTPGITSEQLIIALIDRHRKLDARFPSPQNKRMIEGLQIFLACCKERIDDRMNRGVMGDLKK
jgi:hypothetical protein